MTGQVYGGLAGGELSQAEQTARRAKSLFDEIDLVYESARAAVLLGRIHRAQGNDDVARAELLKSA